MRLLVTHHAPDLDAISSVWMLKTFDNQHYADAKVGFVDPGQIITEEKILDLGYTSADFEVITHTDTGLGEFDHHQKDRGLQHISATSLTYDHCCTLHPELKTDLALKELVRIVTDIDHFADCFWPEANDARYAFMLDAILDGLQRAGLHTDETQLAFGMKCLQGVYKKLEETTKAEQILKRGVEFTTKWGKGVGIETNNDTVIKFAQKSGYAVVIKKDPDEFHARIKGIPIDSLDLTPLADAVMAKDKIGTWYFHASKKMLLNGSEKSANKVATPLTLPELIELAKQTLN
ncbi:MAG: hypothetical protein ABI425_05685 [Patescibacteria group bacterium]